MSLSFSKNHRLFYNHHFLLSRSIYIFHCNRLLSNIQYVTRLFPTVGKNLPAKTPTLACKSHSLMLQHELISSGGSDAFIMMPHCMRSFEKLTKLITKKMQNIKASKISIPSLASAKQWKQSGRWEIFGSELFKLTDRKNSQFCLCPTHEEAVTGLITSLSPISHKHLPIKLYQIGRKFRDEQRPKYGLIRCREFQMKDLYTFDADREAALTTYEEVCSQYDTLFKDLELRCHKVEGSTGAIGGHLSHEYQLPAEIGEDKIFTCEKCGYTCNKEILSEKEQNNQSCQHVFSNESSCIEVAHTFLLGTKYSQVFDANYISNLQETNPMYMGCFGIGISRLLAASLEQLSSNTEIKWPRLIAPYQCVIIPQKKGFKSDLTDQISHNFYLDLCLINSLENEVLYDNRTQLSIGKRIKQWKEFGIPFIIAVGKSALENPPKYEFNNVYREETHYLSKEEILQKLSSLENVTL